MTRTAPFNWIFRIVYDRSRRLIQCCTFVGDVDSVVCSAMAAKFGVQVQRRVPRVGWPHLSAFNGRGAGAGDYETSGYEDKLHLDGDVIIVIGLL